MRDFVSKRIQAVPPSGIRRFFDIAATMKDVISLGIGEPDFVTPEPILRAGVTSLKSGDTFLRTQSALVLEKLVGQVIFNKAGESAPAK